MVGEMSKQFREGLFDLHLDSGELSHCKMNLASDEVFDE